MSDRERFCKRMISLCEAFERDPTEALLESYWIALRDLEEHDFDRAVLVCLRNSHFMPRPVQLRESAGQIESFPVRSNEAWLKVRPLISEDGGALDDPLAELVVQSLGGWQTLGNRTAEENSTWTRKEFLRLYEAYAESPRAIEGLRQRAARLAQRDARKLSEGFDELEEVSEDLLVE